MTKHILIPVALDHEGVVEQKLSFARKVLETGGKITLLTVLENVPGFVAEFVTIESENHLTTKVKAGLDALAAGAEDIDTDVILGKPGVEISRYAGSHDVDLIIVGSHQPGVEDYFLGSTASRVARRAPCSVTILRED